MKALLLPADLSGCGFYRMLFPAMALRERGHDLRMLPYRTEEREDGSTLLRYDPRVAEIALENEVDFVWCQLVNDEVRLRQILALKRLGVPVVMDVDDWYGLVKVQTGKTLVRERHGRQQLKTRTYTYQLLWRALREVDLVTVPTEALAREYRSANPNLRVVPNLLGWQKMWADVIPRYELERPNGEVRVGWLGKVEHGRVDDALVLAGVVEQLLERYPNVRFVAAPSEQAHRVILGEEAFRRRAAEGRILTTGSVEFQKFALSRMLDFDIGVAPLRPSRFNECKSRLKLLEYGAMGIPWVCSSTDEYRRETAASGGGFLAERPRDWLRHLGALIEDRELRERMGRAARERSAQETIERQVRRWEEVLETLPPARRSSRRLLDAATAA